MTLQITVPRSRLSRYSAACKRAAMLLIFLWTCWKSGVVLEINFKFLNLLQMFFFAELLGLQKILFEVLVIMRVRREAKKLHFFFYVVRFLSRLMSFLECTPRFQTELTLAELPDAPPRNRQNIIKSAENLIGPKGIANRLTWGKKFHSKILRGLSWML